MTVSVPCLEQNILGFSSTCFVISYWSPAVRIGILSDEYNVTESLGFVRVQVVKTGSNGIFVSVLFHTSAGTALGKCVHYTGRGMHYHYSECDFFFHNFQLVATTQL